MSIFKKKEQVKTCEAVPFIYGQARRSKRSADYKRSIRKNAERLEEFQKSRGIILHSNSLNYTVCEDLRAYFRGLNLLENTINSNLSDIFHSFRLMKRAGYDVNTEFEDFRLPQEEVTTIFLTTDEIKRIYSIKLKERSVEIIRDLFVVGCFTGMRWSDFSTLSNSNIRGNVIVKKTKKTGVPVEIPMHPIVREIINKYGGLPPYKDTAQNFNNVIKTLCKRAVITDKVYIERTRGGKIERLSVPRYKMVSSHTARRSFATNAYLASIPVARIMLITGHKTEEAFFRYIRISKTENAKTLAGHPFFK